MCGKLCSTSSKYTASPTLLSLGCLLIHDARQVDYLVPSDYPFSKQFRERMVPYLRNLNMERVYDKKYADSLRRKQETHWL